MDKQKNVMDSVSETYIQTAELINKHIQEKGPRKKLFTRLKDLTIEHEKMETEFNVKQRAHKYVQDKNAQVPDLDIEKIMDLMSNQSISEDTKDDWIVSTYCFNASAINTSDTVKAETVFWLEGVCLTSTSIVGIIGNSITIAVLNRISLDNVFNQLIVMLCVIDSMFAGFSLIEYGLKKRVQIAKLLHADLRQYLAYTGVSISQHHVFLVDFHYIGYCNREVHGHLPSIPNPTISSHAFD